MNFPNSDGFPDFSLPEKTDLVPLKSELVPLSPQPLVKPAQVYWREGDRVLAPWEADFLYVGRIAHIQQSQALIEFEDGDSGWVLLDQIRAIALRTGQKVWSRRKMGPTFSPGEIVEIQNDDICVAFDDGRAEEWTTTAALRLPIEGGRKAVAAMPTKVSSHLAFLDRMQPGDRVWAPWNNTTLFAGTVESIEQPEAHIHFDDGDRGWVQLNQLVPLEIPVGLRVLSRWKMGGHYFSGTVTELRDDRIYIVYDDGDKEWTKAAALVIPCQPFGPSARPTKVATHWNLSSLAWTALGVMAVLMVTRVGCR